jgi:ABC-type lipoprotein release transport system permease subunit
MAIKKPSVLEYITFGTTAYTVGSALIPALRAKKINRTKVLGPGIDPD